MSYEPFVCPPDRVGMIKVVGYSLTIPTWPVVVIGANPSRLGVILVNDSNNVIYLRLGEEKPASLGSGVRLNPNGGTLMIDKSFIWTGTIQAIAPVASNLTACEMCY